MSDSFLAQIRRTIATHRLLSAGQRVVVAVSGGADSVALLHAFASLRPALRLTLHLAHLDHGLREEASRDAEFVRGLSSQWGIPGTIERRDVRAICEQEGWSLEDGARRIRYRFLLDVARQQSATRVALAHTADDQAETVLMRLVRGTGLMGLGAIPIRRQLEGDVWIVRPLLEVWRPEVIAYLDAHGIPHREDATNQDPRFMRNRVRRELLPLLERDYNPNIKRALTQLAEQGASDYAYLREAAARQWKRTVKVRPARVEPHPAPANDSSPLDITMSRAHGGVAISIPRFLRQPKALQRQLVREAVQHVRGDLTQFEFRHWLEVERLFAERPQGTLVDLPGGVRLRRDKDHVVCERATVPPTVPVFAGTPG